MRKFINFLVTAFALILLYFFIAPVFLFRILNIGNLAGILICFLLIFKFGFNRKYKEFKEYCSKKKWKKVLWKIYSIAGIIFTIYAILVSGLMIGASFNSPKENSTVIILGAKVNQGGATVALYDRICGAEKYLKANPKSIAIASGGQGADEPMSEGQCIYNYLTDMGIEADRIYIEDKATNTYENIQYSYKIVKENKLDDNLAIATDSYHQLRAKIIAFKQGITGEVTAVNATPTSNISTLIYPTYFVREWFAIPVEVLK